MMLSAVCLLLLNSTLAPTDCPAQDLDLRTSIGPIRLVLDGGMCAGGITTQFRAFAKDRDTSVLNYNGQQVRAALALWTASALAFAAPPGELERVVTERLDTQLNAFVAAWHTGNRNGGSGSTSAPP